MLTIVFACIALLICVTPANAGEAWPTSRPARVWKPARWWMTGAICIHNHESVDWHRRWVDWAGRPSSYAGGMQFMQSTWANAAGRGEPWAWSPREQLYRAFRVWTADGRSWREWGTAGMCGLR